MNARPPWLPLLLMVPYLGMLLWTLWNMDYNLAWVTVILPLAAYGAYLSVSNFRGYLFLLVFMTPLSINLVNIGSGVGLSLPMEIMMGLAAILGVIYFLWDGLPSAKLLKHPVSILILIQLAWIIITSITSTYYSVSFKFTLARMAYLVVFYLLFGKLFLVDNNVRRFIWTYALGLVPIMIYSIFHLGQIGYGRRFSPEMAEPFFDDHTVFGACMAMLIPVLFVWIWNQKVHLEGLRFPKLIWGVLGLALICTAISFSRAAWFSLIGTGIFYLLIRIKISFRAVIAIFASLVILGFVFQAPIVEQMQKNRNVSGEDILATAASVTNVSSDESNAERLNRWSCAVRMGQDKPFFGFGPGTYERNYPDYQILSEMTRISSKTGDRGDAHSEYLTAFSEQGIPGLLIWIGLVFSLIWTGLRTHYRDPDSPEGRLALGILLGLFTYFIHGMVNSFLDIEKAASLFWGLSAALVSLDCRQRVI